MDTQATKSPRVLPRTSWTLISAAQGTHKGSAAALNEFSRRYYRPIQAYLSAIVSDPQEVADMAQGFFTDVVVSGSLLRGANPSRNFRPYLKQALRNYVITIHRKSGAKKRIPEQAMERLDQDPRGWDHIQLKTHAQAELNFHTAWVRELLKEGLRRFEKDCRSRNQSEHFELFRRHYLHDGSRPPSWKELGDTFGLEQKVARSRAQTAARRFGKVLLSLLVDEMGSEHEARRELGTLMELLVEMHG